MQHVRSISLYTTVGREYGNLCSFLENSFSLEMAAALNSFLRGSFCDTENPFTGSCCSHSTALRNFNLRLDRLKTLCYATLWILENSFTSLGAPDSVPLSQRLLQNFQKRKAPGANQRPQDTGDSLRVAHSFCSVK